ncbi:glutathione S-transferase N-terminal domain-containing protein [Rhizobium sp. FKY42]|uniref:glutathione S-transferase family protein n=1 Tax=Rhizobium sp. FKY42 TaxID=2562310 RepID=UPI0010BFDF5B|nr:glutathione S-transferase N-terminal domain-containing protein [Rhizobium sp. FKY42]
MYQLFFSPGACSLASHIALREAGLPFELKRLKFAEGQQRSPDYLKVNPKGRVPALVTPDGTITETPAILFYIAQIAPDKKLAPLDNPFELARLQAFNSFIASTVHVAHAHGPRGSRWANEPTSLEDMRRKVPETMRDGFRLIEQELTGDFVMGDTFTIADPYLFTMSSWLKGDAVEISEFPRVKAHFERMQERPSVREALAAEAVG